MSTSTHHTSSSLEHIRPTARNVFRGLLEAIELEPRPALSLFYTVPTPESIDAEKVPRPPNSFILFKSWISRGFGREEALIADELWLELGTANSPTVAHFARLAREAKAEHLARFPRYKYQPQKRGHAKQTRRGNGEEEGSVEERIASGGEEDMVRLRDPSQPYPQDQREHPYNISIHSMAHPEVEVEVPVVNQHTTYALPGPSALMGGPVQPPSNRSYEDAVWQGSSVGLGAFNPIYIARPSYHEEPYGFLGFPLANLLHSPGLSPAIDSPEPEPHTSFTDNLPVPNEGILAPYLTGEFQIPPPVGEWDPQVLAQIIFEL